MLRARVCCCIHRTREEIAKTIGRAESSRHSQRGTKQTKRRNCPQTDPKEKCKPGTPETTTEHKANAWKTAPNKTTLANCNDFGRSLSSHVIIGGRLSRKDGPTSTEGHHSFRFVLNFNSSFAPHQDAPSYTKIQR